MDVCTHNQTQTALADTPAELQGMNAQLLLQNGCFDPALENIRQGLCVLDADSHLVVFNICYCEIFGLPPVAATKGALSMGMS